MANTKERVMTPLSVSQIEGPIEGSINRRGPVTIGGERYDIIAPRRINIREKRIYVIAMSFQFIFIQCDLDFVINNYFDIVRYLPYSKRVLEFLRRF